MLSGCKFNKKNYDPSYLQLDPKKLKYKTRPNTEEVENTTFVKLIKHEKQIYYAGIHENEYV